MESTTEMPHDATVLKDKKAAVRKTVATLGTNDCRWPIGDPQIAGFHFCGEHASDGHPYCKKHTAQASTPARPRPIQNRNWE